MGLPIELPPLRERGNDILVLAKHFTVEFARENRMTQPSISQEAMDKLLRYHFPGNVRELKAIMDLAVVLSDGKEIRPADIKYEQADIGPSLPSGEKTLRQFTCEIITRYLRKYNNDVVTTAQKLDIGKSTIYKMIQQKEVTL
jgi:DNA-binding NtrC family response regulator